MTAFGATLGDRLLSVLWADAVGGRRVDVANLTITIVKVSDSSTVLAATSTGVEHGRRRGYYRYVWETSALAAGSYTVTWNADDADGDAVSVAETVTVGGTQQAAVTVADVVDYIGADAAARWTDDFGVTYPQITDALAAETVTQLGKVTYRPATAETPVPDNSDLIEALKRRVQRNLAMRALPLSIQQGADAATRVGGTDPEIRRLEAARRKLVVG